MKSRAGRSSHGSRTSTSVSTSRRRETPRTCAVTSVIGSSRAFMRSMRTGGPCSWVGPVRSCSRGHPGAFHVRLDGPPERRARRGALWEGIDLATARARLVETDEARARYTRTLYQHDPADPALYHMLLDESVLGVEVCVDLIATAADAFWKYDDTRLEEAARRIRAALESVADNPADTR